MYAESYEKLANFTVLANFDFQIASDVSLVENKDRDEPPTSNSSATPHDKVVIESLIPSWNWKLC
jgi:hypothetical protein